MSDRTIYQFGTVTIELNQVDIEAPSRWMGKGVQDFRRAFLASLVFGLFFVVFGDAIVGGLLSVGGISLALVSSLGFIFVSPVCCWFLYRISRGLETDQKPGISDLLAIPLKNTRRMGPVLFVVSIIYMAWLETAVLLIGLFLGHHGNTFVAGGPLSVELIAVTVAGTMIGMLYCAVLFSLTVVTVPMQYLVYMSGFDAMRLSIRCVLLNKRVMASWAILVGFITVISLIPGFLGLVVSMPILAYASWHAFRDLVTVTGGTDALTATQAS
ncbi:MAG: DUF2189 domain-containing protein [Rhodospirillaceae bacterium]